MSKKENIPTHDPQTGELNPYYRKLTGDQNPLTKQLRVKYPPLRFDKEHISTDDIMKGLKVPPSKDKDLDKVPNQKWHQIISFIKSGIRIVGYILIPYDLVISASVLVFSEIIGIVEELV